MPFVLLIVGGLAVVSVLRGTEKELGAAIIEDMKGSAGSPGYIWWVSSILAVGMIGYYPPAQRFSRAFMLLIILGMVLANRGLFTRIQQALQNPQETQPSQNQSAPNWTLPQNQQSSAQGSDAMKTATTALQVAEVGLMLA